MAWASLAGALLYLAGFYLGRGSVEIVSEEEVWDTAVLLGAYGERLRTEAEALGVTVSELAGFDPRDPADRCKLCERDF